MRTHTYALSVYLFGMDFYLFLSSHNGRVVDIGRDLWKLCSPIPVLREGLGRAD